MKVISKKDSSHINCLGTIGELNIFYYVNRVYPRYIVSHNGNVTGYPKYLFNKFWITEKELRLKKLKKLNKQK